MSIGIANSLKEIKIDSTGRFLAYEDGSPLFLLADTQWELTHRSTRETADRMLDDRQAKGFNAINLALLFHWANMEKNAYGVLSGTPGNWNKAYWDHVDYVVDAIIERGMHPVLFPAWGNIMGGEDNLFTEKNAEEFGRWIANRYKDRNGLMYVLGGDRVPDEAIVNAVGKGLHSVSPEKLISFHPHNSKSSSWYFHESEWLDLHMIQSGHETRDQVESYTKITGLVTKDYSLSPTRPVIDIEPRYEQYFPHDKPPMFDDYDVRVAAYWGVFAGGAGTGYAQNQAWAWGRYDKGEVRVWEEINSAASFQLRHLKALMLSRPYFSRVPDNSIIANLSAGMSATRGDGYAFVHLHEGQNVEIQMGKISGNTINVSWYNPRTGTNQNTGTVENTGSKTFDPPGIQARGNDWVLILDDGTRHFPPPETTHEQLSE